MSTPTASLVNRRVILTARPKGVPGPEFFALDEAPLAEPAEGQILVHNRFLSVDPAMRGWVNDAPNYAPPVPVGAVMRAFAAGEVVASRHPDFAAGETVTGLFGWQRFALTDGADVTRKVAEHDLPLSLALGVLGLNGVTAYFGLLDVCAPKPGETVVVSTAAGAVGATVGQIARLKGCRAVGIAGGAAKVKRCLDEFGYDAAIDYKGGTDLDAALEEACPEGVDVYFDNTCGPVSDAVMRHLAAGARIVICGTAAIADWQPWPEGPRVHRQLLVSQARMQGFLVFRYQDRYAEAVARLAAWVREGRLAYREHVLDGLDKAPSAIRMLYRGENTGKLLIKVD